MAFQIILILTFFLFMYSTQALYKTENFKIPRKDVFDYQYKTFYFEQLVDHFSFTTSDTYKQRYLVADQYWDKSFGPIFFYTGNEGDIAWFCNNTGLMWDWASEFKALLIFAEHRYYGQSLPYGNDSFLDPRHLGFLTSEQALADFATLILDLKATIPGAENSAVIAFGGSYGGMLSAWFRMKYPHIVAGALAASAPIWQFGDLVPCYAYNRIVTKDFQESGPNCAQSIRKSWDVITSYGKSVEGRSFLSHTFRLCNPLMSSNDVDSFKGWLTETYGSLAMVDYPYSANFLEPLPAWPIKKVCSYLQQSDMSPEELMAAIRDAVGVYYNSTGTIKCFDIGSQATPDLGDLGWGFQACTEMVMPMCSDGINDMFEPSTWDLAAYLANCQQTWGVTAQPSWAITNYGGKDINAASNIIFSNGLLDPWSGGGVMTSPSQSLYVVVIADGAHHLDLRGANQNDTNDVRVAREAEKIYVKKFIFEHQQMVRGNYFGGHLTRSHARILGFLGRSNHVVVIGCGLIVCLLCSFVFLYIVHKRRKLQAVSRKDMWCRNTLLGDGERLVTPTCAQKNSSLNERLLWR